MPHMDFALGSTLLAKQPRCLRCGVTMQLVRLEPIPPHTFQRTFECPTCEISPAKEANVTTMPYPSERAEQGQPCRKGGAPCSG